ncbi:putative RNA methyltransferase [Pseudactinotalea sp.]|uniref:putative RNA methyltransferase n=1 Tax=Pseudactinotalea sp. TaxID=1926260 RepID=UPI003B3A7D31
MSSISDASSLARHESSRPLIPDSIIRALRCPLCRQQLTQDTNGLSCSHGHSFDRAKQGYVTLRPGDRTPQNADTTSMVMAREVLLGTGIYEPIRERAAELIAAEATSDSSPIIADLAGGTGYYLAGILDRLPSSFGMCVDLSAAALKRAARSHPRATAIGADLGRPLPVGDATVCVATSFFGPRNVPEIRRVMRTTGVLLVVTPTVRHLAELVEPLGMLTVDQRKDERLRTTMSSLVPLQEERIEYREPLTNQQIRAIVGMGPSAHHINSEQLESRMRRLPEGVVATVSVNLRVYGRGERES